MTVPDDRRPDDRRPDDRRPDDRVDPVFRFDLAQDPMADVLRGVLTREAEAVQPSADGLARIRSAVDAGHARAGTHPSRRWMPLVAAAAAVVLVGGVGAGVLAVRRPSAPVVPNSASFDNRDAPSVSPGQAVPLPVYVAARRADQLRLVREYARTNSTDPDARVTEAVMVAVSGTHQDRDYTSLFASLAPDVVATVRAHVAADQRSITVDLPAALTLAEPSSTATARLAVQQVVWTATAAASLTVPVQLTVGGQTARLFGSISGSQAFERSWGDDPRAPAWIDSVVDNTVLGRGTQLVTGVAVAAARPEVQLTLRRDGVVVDTRTVGLTDSERQPGQVPRAGARGSWQARLDLRRPGRYELTVSVAAASDTAAGNGYVAQPWTDTKIFTVG